MKKYALVLSAALIVLSVVYTVYRTNNRNYYSSSVSSVSGALMKNTIILDAGHGGFDGGATAINGIIEKDLNLQIALKLRDYLTFYGFQVIMTRTEDVGTDNIPDGTIRERKVSDIHNRTDLLNKTSGGILISIHQNFYSDRSCRGTQVFYSTNSNQSKTIAQSVQKEVVSSLQPDNTRFVKAAGNEIYLLRHAENPAILVECGFISNETDTKLLSDDIYQKKLSFCIAKAMYEYACDPEG